MARILAWLLVSMKWKFFNLYNREVTENLRIFIFVVKDLKLISSLKSNNPVQLLITSSVFTISFLLNTICADDGNPWNQTADKINVTNGNRLRKKARQDVVSWKEVYLGTKPRKWLVVIVIDISYSVTHWVGWVWAFVIPGLGESYICQQFDIVDKWSR